MIRAAVALSLFVAALPPQGAANRSLLAPRGAAPVSDPIAAIVGGPGRAVVHVFVEVRGGAFRIERPSSGVIVSRDGLVATLYSLVAEADGAADKQIVVALGDEARTRLVARIAAHDEKTGLALLRVDPPEGLPLTAAAIAGGDPRPGVPAVVVADPRGEGRIAFAGVAGPAAGPAVLEGRRRLASELLVTDAMIDERAHGAALLDRRGRLLGICSAEHVARPVQEPTLEDLMAPSFGCAIPSRLLIAAFAAELPQAKPSPEPPPTPEERAVARVAPSVVSVLSGREAPPDIGDLDPLAEKRRNGVGSGVILSEDGFVATNDHLLQDGGPVRVALADGRSFAASVVKRHKGTNLALLRLDLADGAKVPAAPLSFDEIPLGATVLGVGNPFGRTPTVTVGILSQRRPGGRLQADPNLGNQNAGGALVDLGGRVVAIVDGGRIDKVEQSWRRQGDEAKTETNLSTCFSIPAIAKLFGSALWQSLGTGSAPRLPGTPLRDEASAAIERAGGAMLNVFVSWSSAQADEEANPFASVQNARILTQSLGSGVIIDSSGLAITNWHVVDAATEPDGSMRKDHAIHVRTFEGAVHEARVLSISREDDLALLQLLGRSDFPFVELGCSESVRVGDAAIAIGNPLGQANTITKGIVCAKDQEIRVKGRWAKLEHLLETDAAINGGNSGGALLDSAGRLIGINSAGSRGFSRRGYAIEVDHVRDRVLHLLLTAEKLRSPSLGMTVADRDGAVIASTVDPYGPAARAGISAGERLLAMGDAAIDWPVAFSMKLLHWPDGRDVPLRIEHAGKERTVLVRPMSAMAWAVHRQSGLDLEVVPISAEPDMVRKAWIALHRAFTGDPEAMPLEIQDRVLRVARVQPGVQEESADVLAGDLLLGAELHGRSAAGDVTVQKRFVSIEQVRALFDDRELSSYDGREFTCWFARGDAVRRVRITARRLLP